MQKRQPEDVTGCAAENDARDTAKGTAGDAVEDAGEDAAEDAVEAAQDVNETIARGGKSINAAPPTNLLAPAQAFSLSQYNRGRHPCSTSQAQAQTPSSPTRSRGSRSCSRSDPLAPLCNCTNNYTGTAPPTGTQGILRRSERKRDTDQPRKRAKPEAQGQAGPAAAKPTTKAGPKSTASRSKKQKRILERSWSTPALQGGNEWRYAGSERRLSRLTMFRSRRMFVGSFLLSS
jgi:hypothetical protein